MERGRRVLRDAGRYTLGHISCVMCISSRFFISFFFLTSSSPPFLGRGDGLQLISWPIPTSGFSCTTAARWWTLCTVEMRSHVSTVPVSAAVENSRRKKLISWWVIKERRIRFVYMCVLLLLSSFPLLFFFSFQVCDSIPSTPSPGAV